MAQSTYIALALVAGFLVYVTARGELPTYLAILGVTSGASAGTTATSTSTSAGSAIGALAPLGQGIGTLPNLLGSSANQDFSGGIAGDGSVIGTQDFSG